MWKYILSLEWKVVLSVGSLVPGWILFTALHLLQQNCAACAQKPALTAGSSKTPGSRDVDLRWPSFSLDWGSLKVKTIVLNKSVLVLMWLGPVLGSVKFFLWALLLSALLDSFQSSLCFISEDKHFIFKTHFCKYINNLQFFVLLFPYWTRPTKNVFQIKLCFFFVCFVFLWCWVAFFPL